MAQSAETFGALFGDLGRVFEDHKAALDELSKAIEETDKEKAQFLLDTIVDGVLINGVPVREMVGPENIPTFHSLKKANYNVTRMLQTAVEDQ